ncbi:MAG: hypothetical protein NT130_03630 [Candidatus Micrarchaeota archaeon]|nr:hypothetical protein [Candidatus Micrarchaeota archaeon]
MSPRAQGAIELLVILAMIALAGLVIYSTSQNTLAESSKALIVSQARATVNDLSSAASEVYSEGVGARRKVYITIPEGVDSSKVYVNNTMINIGLKIGGQTSDINTQTSMRLLQGSDFPTTPGGYWVDVVAKNGYVLIGSSYLSIVPQSISVEMPPSNSTSTLVTFTNMGSVPLNVTLSPQWTYAGVVNMSLNTTNFILSTSGDSSTSYVNVNFITYQDTPLQPYAGTINVATNSSETAQIDVYVNVVGNQLPTGVSYITIDTFKDSGYSSPTTNFALPYYATINGSNWNEGIVTLDILGPSGSSVSGYPVQLNVNSSGIFIYNEFNPAGLQIGVYNILASQSETNASYSFNITACP